MKHLSRWTKELFGYDDNLILYDLTNVYAEGDYDDSKWWDYGRSKEKRNDCKLLVLALVVNRHGFPKHYQLFEGRMQDYDSIVKIIDELDAHMKSLGVSPIVVMDAGIATAENLDLLRERNYKFLCVSRSSRKAYKPIEGEPVQHMEDKLHQPLEIQRVEVEFKPGKDGLTVWTIYNILKEVESSFRCMKTDLNLRPVFHKKDKPCLAHLHLGILAYWVVATIRYQLRQKGYTKGWTQIVEVMNTQHSVATDMKNLQGDTIHIENPTEPTEQVKEICEKVGITPVPYKMKKSVGVQISERKNEGKENQVVIEPDTSNTG